MVSPAPIDERSSNLVKELTEADVLLGRGTGPNEYQGNIRFRALVKTALRSYEFQKSTGSTKTMLARMIVHDVKAQTGWFLKKVGTSSTTGGDLFAVAPDRVAVDKTRQSFRHQLKSTRKPPKTATGRSEQEDCLLDSSRESFEKLSSSKSGRSPVLSAVGVMKEDEAKSISTLTAGSTISGLGALLPQQAKITGLIHDTESPLASSKMHGSVFLERAGDFCPTSSRVTSPGMNAFLEANMKQRVAHHYNQYLPRLSFPSCLGRDEGYLARRVPLSSRTGALDRLRLELGALDQAARDNAYMEDLILLRTMNAHY
jgi:hypothetical protein